MKNSVLCFVVAAAFLATAWADTDRIPIHDVTAACTDGALGKYECNNCFCSNGRWACTLMGCLPSHHQHKRDVDDYYRPQPVCEDGQQKMEDCNSCFCNRGQWACTLMACPILDTAHVKGLNNASLKQECVIGDKAAFECNDCECWDQRWKCDRMQCHHNHQPQCGAGDRRNDRCTSCVCCCGKWICSWSEHCPPQEGFPTPPPPRAVTQAPYRPATPSYVPPPPPPPLPSWGRPEEPVTDPIPLPLPIPAPVEVCRNGQTKMKECNSCICFGGFWACTMKGCYQGRPYSSYSSQPQTPDCRHGETKEVDCNQCLCMAGSWACQDKACPITQARPAQYNPYARQPPKETCRDGEHKMDDCNHCTCMNGGWACTRMGCPSMYHRSSAPQPLQEGQDCQAGQTKREDCNDCTCIKGYWACTDAVCPQQTCNHGDTEMRDCNHCNCYHGNWICTQKACPVLEQVDEGRILLDDDTVFERCNDGELGQHECNTCRCGNGEWACTRMACPRTKRAAVDPNTSESHDYSEEHTGKVRRDTDPNTSESHSSEEVQPQPKTKRVITDQDAACVDGEEGTYDCNNCWCNKGRWGCTRMTCPDNDNLLTVAFRKRRNTEGDIDISAPCNVGDTGKYLCNNCDCRSGFWRCTRRFCSTAELIQTEARRRRQVEEDTIDPAAECADGETGRYKCNNCHCSDGRWACTRRTCGVRPINLEN